MALLEVKLIPKLTYKLRLSPQIKLSLNLLQLPLVKLKEYIIEQIEKNPFLESVDSEAAHTDKQIRDITREETKSEMDWTEEDEERKQYQETLIAAALTLQDHLLKQLYLLTDVEEEHKIGEEIIGNIDDDGYLRCSVEKIAESGKMTTSQAKKVLSFIQTFSPMGIGARDLRECLLLQLKAKQEENSLAGKIVDKYLSFLEKKQYKFIAKKLSVSGGKVSVEEIKEAIETIAKLEPRPGRSFSAEKTLRLIPDAILKRSKDGYEIILNDWELPSLTINAKYKEMLEQDNISGDARIYLRERLNAAKTLIGAINKRRQTIQDVFCDIVNFQKDAFNKESADFKPMTLAQIAKRIGKHKSTVSRAMANKYLQTPQGILELRYFLNSGVKQENGDFFSSRNIKLTMLEWIKFEDKGKPLTDQEIVNRFKRNGIFISRRAIAKYRKQLKILPSKSRQR